MPELLQVHELDLGPDAPAYIGEVFGGRCVVLLNSNKERTTAEQRMSLRVFAMQAMEAVRGGEPLVPDPAIFQRDADSDVG